MISRSHLVEHICSEKVSGSSPGETMLFGSLLFRRGMNFLMFLQIVLIEELGNVEITKRISVVFGCWNLSFGRSELKAGKNLGFSAGWFRRAGDIWLGWS